MSLPERGELMDCKCEGRNPNCQICNGKGYYYQLPDSKKPQKNISDPSDPFPPIMKDSTEPDSENPHIKRHLEKYALQLKKNRKIDDKKLEQRLKSNARRKRLQNEDVDDIEKKKKKRF